MDPNISYYGIVILLRNSGNAVFYRKELKKIAARIATDSGVEVVFFSDFLHLSVAIWMQLW